MKIDSHKFAKAPRLAERSQPATAAASNTGIVPTSKRPSDNFEQVSTRPGNVTTGNVGVTGTVRGKTQVNLDFDLDPRLEPHRGLFAWVGAKIADMPEHKHESAIEKSSKRLSKFLGQPLDIVREGVTNAYNAARRAPPPMDDPQCYKAARHLDKSAAAKAVEGQLTGIARPLAGDSTLRRKKDILAAARPQLERLGLQGRDLKIAERYITGVVREERTRASGAFAGTQLPRLNTGTLQFLPRE